MQTLCSALVIFAVAASASTILGEQTWSDPSPHRVQFVTVDAGVQLEVLDWGGTGRPLLLLHGSGVSAHNFDDFAPKIRCCHVYGITRRGHGRSTHALSGYDEQRLADDVLHVIDALHLVRPVIAGHSMAGAELTTLGRQHSSRLGGLIYLDALGDPRNGPQSDPRFGTLSGNLPPNRQQEPEPHGDARTFTGYRDWQFRTMGFRFPEADLRNIFESRPGDLMGRYVSPSSIFTAIGEAQQARDYHGITVPVLAFVEPPRRRYDPALDRYQVKNDEERQAIEAFGDLIATYLERWTAQLKAGVPEATVVELPGAGHYMFLTRESDVLREIDAFVRGL